MATELELAFFASQVYQDRGNSVPLPPGWTIVGDTTGQDGIDRIHTPADPGFAARAYVNDDTNEFVIAIRGTDDTNPDWIKNNSKLIAGFAPPQLKDAFAFFKNLIDDVDVDNNALITFTGQSLGGAQASLTSMLTGRKATVFAPAPNQRAAKSFLNSTFFTDVFTGFSIEEIVPTTGVFATATVKQLITNLQNGTPVGALPDQIIDAAKINITNRTLFGEIGRIAAGILPEWLGTESLITDAAVQPAVLAEAPDVRAVGGHAAVHDQGHARCEARVVGRQVEEGAGDIVRLAPVRPELVLGDVGQAGRAAAIHEGRFDQARRDGVDPDAVRCEPDRGGADQVDDRGPRSLRRCSFGSPFPPALPSHDIR